MELAGESGSLLRIENDIRDAVREIYGEHGRLFRVGDEERWRKAAGEVIRAVTAYAERAADGRAFQRRLFVKDAARPRIHRPRDPALAARDVNARRPTKR